MTATMSKPTLESTLEGLVRLHYAQRGGDMAVSKAEVAKEYWQRGIREGIAAILFQHRGDSLPRFKTIPMIYESDVNAILREYETEFVHGGPGDKVTAIDVIYAKFIELAVPQDLIETDEEERRRLVLSGEEKAVPGDRGWIDALVEEKRREADRLIAILQGQKVNDAGGKLPRTQPKCAQTGCPTRLGEFATKDQYIAHLRDEHNYTPQAANRYGSEGWSRRITWVQSSPEHAGYGVQPADPPSPL